ncbi:hypothetical protein C8F04DRAFT_1274957 [Mycena alexandri]|uniref:Uncharacterized protein n=1 Tax=Mycena alexandri TaxID=1745969 RepID=A0AAD6S4T1_9AGAR|nr:hypothetical protein C8F04DRAFT_1274957 [Mycena alexandri]
MQSDQIAYTYATRRRGKEEALYVVHEGSLIPPSLVPPFPSLSSLSFACDVFPASVCLGRVRLSRPRPPAGRLYLPMSFPYV